MTNERCELRHRLQEDGDGRGWRKIGSERIEAGKGCRRDAGSLVRARLDMLDVGGTGVVRHITPLIQCISGCEQLARESQPF